MKHLMEQLQVSLNSNLYLKDPKSTELGERIVQRGMEMIDEVGLEQFTFRKLANDIGTTETSVYRYFLNKHRLLLYLTSTYYAWLEYQLIIATSNVPSAEEKLKNVINLLVSCDQETSSFNGLNLEVLTRLVISESSKAYLTKQVDTGNKDGLFSGYKRLVNRLAEISLEINPDYQYPHALMSTMIEGIHHQKYFADHLPALTDHGATVDHLETFYQNMVLSTLANNHV
jgi:AcrR family transcriptional regulator